VYEWQLLPIQLEIPISVVLFMPVLHVGFLMFIVLMPGKPEEINVWIHLIIILIGGTINSFKRAILECKRS
jgi:hypothetical protein